MRHSLIVFLGSGLGGVARLLFNNLVTSFIGGSLPWGILAINVLGSTAMGVVAGWFAFRGHAAADLRLFLTTGILGGFTTFSSFSLDAALLYERGRPGFAATYVAASVLLSILGLFAGLWSVRLASSFAA
jgi:fluoride exporter